MGDWMYISIILDSGIGDEWSASPLGLFIPTETVRIG
jgi:hypothetical protein